MAQLDYIRRGQSITLRRNSSLKIKQNKLISIFLLTFTILSGLLIYFISIMQLTANHKKKAFTSELLKYNKVIDNALPPKPKEHWYYVKELENRKLIVSMKDQSYAVSQRETKNKHFTIEQNKIFTQIQADMRQHPTHLNRTLFNRKMFIKHQYQAQNQQKWINIKSIQKLHTQPRHAIMQTASVLQQVSNITKKSNVSGQILKRQKDERQWIVQCGSFKDLEQAESVRAKVSLEGFNSCIKNNNGWNRVMIGPMKDVNIAENTIAHLEKSSYVHCVRLVYRD